MRALGGRAFGALVVGVALLVACHSPKTVVIEAPPTAALPACRIADESSRALQRLLDGSVRENRGYGGGILRIDSLDCGLIWEGVSGRREHDGLPMRTYDTFEITGITETFTATVALQLVEQRRLALDAAVPPDIAPVPGATLHQLLAQRSGAPDYWTDPPFANPRENVFLHDFMADAKRFWAPSELLAYAKKLTPIGDPGAAYHAADTNYVAAGLAIERATGQPLPAAIRERILGPLGMADTFFAYREVSHGPNSESARYEGETKVLGQRRQSAEWGGGGLVSSTHDLATFVFTLARGGLFEDHATFDEMQDWKPTSEKGVDYGLGLFRMHLESESDTGLWGHDGHNAFMFYWPQRRIAFTGTLNQLNNDWWTLVAAAIGVIDSDGVGHH